MLLIGFEFNIFCLLMVFFLAISNTTKCGNHSALQIVWVENSTWVMFVTMEICLLMDQMLNSLAVVSFSFPRSLSLSIRPVAIYSFTQGLETKTKRLLKLSIYTLNSVSWNLATWESETGWFSTYRIVHIWNFLRWTFCM